MTEIDTERLHLRPLRITDSDALLVLHRNPDMQRYFGDGHLYTRDESRGWLEWHIGLWDEEGYSFFAVELRSSARFIGWLGLNKVFDQPDLSGQTEIGWFIDSQLWGQGLATEGAQEALTFGFSGLRLQRVIARYRTDNVASGRVMEKIGMRRWQIVPHADVPGMTTTMYEIDADEHVVRT